MLRLVCILLLLTAPALAQEGAAVRVHVTDAATGDPLVEARVQVVRGGAGSATTDADGNCQLDLESGRYELRITADLYRSRRVAVTLQRGGPRLVIKLRPDMDTIEEVVVVGAPDTASEAVGIVRRRKAASVSDAISAEQMSRTPDSSAGDAVKRVVAATVTDGKYVVVRGLGGRYTSTLLNGVALPSPDPDNPAAPLDLFPAALLANLTVTKTFNPDIPGNFAGGSLSIETREFPDKFTLKLRASTSLDTSTTFRDTATSSGGGLDFLGYDDGTRSLPAAIPAQRVNGESGLTLDQLNGIARSFKNNWGLEHAQARPNLGFGGTVGDTLQRGETRFGYLGSLSYGNKWARRAQTTRAIGANMEAKEEFHNDTGVASTSLGGLVNLGLSPSPSQRLSAIAFYSHSSDDQTEIASGRTEAGQNLVERIRMRFVERGLVFGQLAGEHDLADHFLTLGWQGNLSQVTQAEPDVRDVDYFQTDAGRMKFDTGPGSGNRDFVDLSDLSGGGGASVTLSWKPIKVKIGGAAQLTSRELSARRFNFYAPSGVDLEDPRFLERPEGLFSPDNMGTLLRIKEVTRPGDGYAFDRNIFAGYAMVDLTALDPLRLVTGARIELAHQALQDSTLYSGAPLAPPLERDDVNVMPAANAILALGAAQNLRASYSATVARPHVREVAPFLFVDYTRGRVYHGNPEVKTSTIHNFDLRFERFFGATDLVAASAFYKRFIEPIEAVVDANNDISFQNVQRAQSYGLELEARFALPANFRVAANLSLIRSSVDFSEMQALSQFSKSRPLQGQSPYVGNVEAGWRIPSAGSDFTVLYNVLGRRITEAGVEGVPDTYEQPFHRLDFSYTQALPASLKLKLSGTNLLNQRVELKQADLEVLGYDPGVAFIAGLEWSYDR